MTQRLDISERAEGVDILAPARTAQRELPHLSVEAEGVLCVDASGVDSVCSGAENTRAAGAGLAFLGDTNSTVGEIVARAKAENSSGRNGRFRSVRGFEVTGRCVFLRRTAR